MARRRRSTLSLSADQARQALAFLVHEGKLATPEVQKALQRREKLLREIRERIAQLGKEELDVAISAGTKARRKVRAARKASRPTRNAPRPARKRARPRISAATRKLYQTQGRYMAALRQLPKAARAKIKAIRAESGVNTAIREAKSRLAEKRFIARQSGSPGQRKNRKQIRLRRSKYPNRRWKTNAEPRSYPERSEPEPDKHGGSGAGRQQGGSGVGRERD